MSVVTAYPTTKEYIRSVKENSRVVERGRCVGLLLVPIRARTSERWTITVLVKGAREHRASLLPSIFWAVQQWSWPRKTRLPSLDFLSSLLTRLKR
jgi:hypothetical protein